MRVSGSRTRRPVLPPFLVGERGHDMRAGGRTWSNLASGRRQLVLGLSTTQVGWILPTQSGSGLVRVAEGNIEIQPDKSDLTNEHLPSGSRLWPVVLDRSSL